MAIPTHSHFIGWAQDALKRCQLSSAPARGRWPNTEPGRALLAQHPSGLPAAEVTEIAHTSRHTPLNHIIAGGGVVGGTAGGVGACSGGRGGNGGPGGPGGGGLGGHSLGMAFLGDAPAQDAVTITVDAAGGGGSGGDGNSSIDGAGGQICQSMDFQSSTCVP